MNLRVTEQAYVSDTGRQRTANEDSFFAGAKIFAVADGMGGAQAGEVASRIAAESFGPAERGESSPEAYLREIATTANRRINDLAAEDESRSGMGTTFTAALVEGEDVSFAHVGDSRAYVFRDGELRMLTSDHSLVEELRRQGKLTDAQAEDHPQRSIITRALGPEPEVEVDTMTYRARAGDVYLLCSDGLTTMVKDEEIAGVLEDAGGLEAAADELIEQANSNGGRDNITVVLFRLEEAGDEAPVDETATLVGPTAAGAGLTGDAVRERAAAAEADPVASRRSRRPAPARGSRRRRLVKVAITLLLIAGVVAAAIWGARQVYFLGGDEGRLALYRGLPYDLPFGIELYSQVPTEVDSVAIADLSQQDQELVTNHELRSQDDALTLLEDLEGRVEPEPEPRPGVEQGGAAGGGGGGGAGGGGGGAQGADAGGGQGQGAGGN